jgi:hypothetical protein
MALTFEVFQRNFQSANFGQSETTADELHRKPFVSVV